MSTCFAKLTCYLDGKISKEELNRDISEAIYASMDNVRIFNDKVSGKRINKELTSSLNTDYGFKIDKS